MEVWLVIVIMAEILAAAAVIVGFVFFDERLAAWENRKIREWKARKCSRWINEDGLEVVVRYGR